MVPWHSLPWITHWILEHGRVPPLDHDGWAYVIVVAEKGVASTWNRVPTRAKFRTEVEQAHWRANRAVLHLAPA